MIKKISSVSKEGGVLFVDEKGTGTTYGTKADCNAYGFKYRNGKCYCYDTKTKPTSDKNKNKGNILNGAGNFALGIGNKITSGVNNVAIGFKNLIEANSNYSIAIGKNSYTENLGEVAISNSKIANRAKLAIHQFDGISTDENPTELYLGGHIGARLFINESYESSYMIKYTISALNAASNQIWCNYGEFAYKYVNSTLSEVGHLKGTAIRDSALNYDIEFAAVSGTPDYIEMKVEGDSGHTVYWTVVLQVTEVRYG